MDRDRDVIHGELAYPVEDPAPGFESGRGIAPRSVRAWAGFEVDPERPSEKGVTNLFLLYRGSRHGYKGELLY